MKVMKLAALVIAIPSAAVVVDVAAAVEVDVDTAVEVDVADPVCLFSLVLDLATAVAIVDSTLSTAFLFSERFFSLFFIESVSWLHAWMISPTSSSYFLHFPKVLLHWFMAWTVEVLLAAKSHSLMTEVTSSLSEDQQEQASDPDRLMHVSVWFLM